MPAPEALGEGCYRLDLGAALASDPGLNARVVLLPVLEARDFRALEIHCDHLPRWFDATLRRLALSAEVTSDAEGVHAHVVPMPPAAGEASTVGEGARP
ncbi:Fe-only nitrogenase accessory AnfO family protein [Pararhodospirillum oryzae]|uniref:Uncharacterized protein n=1 Tax=Pararhodospirillum oryzae TaxID=478448 RepID=A0A512H886_9PROT|nr:Fe-only nitrogenase accessory AnfO family protein [Pararhodospirillum oryzae]GEO81663.1 hypothetical protein ROR02_17940 [Pararhodospirillum oryzae]